MKPASILFALLCLSACIDTFYPPFLENGLDLEVVLEIKWQDGSSGQGVLKPGERFVFGQEAARVEVLTISGAGFPPIQYRGPELVAMVTCHPDSRGITWFIRAGGLQPSEPCQAKG